MAVLSDSGASRIGDSRGLDLTHTSGRGAQQDVGILLPLKIFYGPKARLNHNEGLYRLLWNKYFKNERN